MRRWINIYAIIATPSVSICIIMMTIVPVGLEFNKDPLQPYSILLSWMYADQFPIAVNRVTTTTAVVQWPTDWLNNTELAMNLSWTWVVLWKFLQSVGVGNGRNEGTTISDNRSKRDWFCEHINECTRQTQQSTLTMNKFDDMLFNNKISSYIRATHMYTNADVSWIILAGNSTF